MPNTTYTIKVSLNTTASPPVTVDTESLEVDYGANYVIKWQPAAEQEGWVFKQISPSSAGGSLPDPPFSSQTVHDDEIEVEDDNDVTGDVGTFNYSIQVEKDGTKYWSDPKIINKAGG